MTGDTVSFLEVDFARLDIDQVLGWLRDAMDDGQFRYVVTPNVDHAVKLHRASGQPWHAAFRNAVMAADLRLNDSRILKRLGKFSAIELTLVPGSDLTARIVNDRVAAGRKLALIGGRADDAEWLRRHSGAADIIHFQPPMGVLHNTDAQQAIVDYILTENPELTLFAIGAPQSEIVAHRIARHGGARGVGLCIGASVEFLTGAKQRAPVAMQRLGLEWAFRLLSEPKRMWRRYLVEGPKIFLIWGAWTRQRPGAK